MGEVFAARHMDTGEVFALKALTSTSATRLYRFKQEFRALADVSHDNLVRLHELVIPDEGPPFFTMELLEGKPFVEWVRQSTPVGVLPELPRLERGLRQLILGTHHLHSHGYIHRDLKPSNVMVTPEGRLVVLDFGIVSDTSDHDRRITREEQILGTPSYMAPEQARGQRTDPAADYYAIGVMLFESLTGRLPREGSALMQMLAKQDTTVDPGEDLADLPETWRTLCVRLLARDPGRRPGGPELLERLQVSHGPRQRAEATFIGRERELDDLHDALAAVRRQRSAVVVHLYGRSGDGKSALTRQFRSMLDEEASITLHGRCREQEMIPFKGIDAIVDALCVYFRQLPADGREGLCPRDLDALIRLFPVLDGIWEAPRTKNLALSEVRMLGGVTLRKLLCQVAERHPLVIHIDDFQWADQDSVRLLEVLSRSPNSPAMLLLLSYRSERVGSKVLSDLEDSRVLSGPEARRIELRPLPGADAYELALRLVRTTGAPSPQDRAKTIALRAQGSPFFIQQMALLDRNLGVDESDLEQVVAGRLSDLDHDALRLLEVVAVFGGPLPMELARELCDVNTETVASLCEKGLLSRGSDIPGKWEDCLEAAHDKVREIALRQLDGVERTRLHRRMGECLRPRGDEEVEADTVFAAVDHLMAGMAEGDASRDGRLELARLGSQAGRRALESGAWVAARRYFDFAHNLLGPGFATARGRRVPEDLYVTVAFGRAQAAIMLDDPNGDDDLQELLGWSLPTADYCRVAQWYCETLFSNGRFQRCVEFGVHALNHLGTRISSQPSWPRALISFYRGWRSIWRTGLGRIRDAHRAADIRTRTIMDILAIVSPPAATVDVALQLDMSGVYARLLAKHGPHDHVGLGLSGLVLSAMAMRKYDEARLLAETVEGLLERPETPTTSYYMTQISLRTAISPLRPLRNAGEACRELYRRANEVASRPLAEFMGAPCFYVFQIASTPLRTVGEFASELAACRGFTFSFMEELHSEIGRQNNALIQGPAVLELNVDPGPNMPDIIRSWMFTTRALTAMFLGDFAGAEASILKISTGSRRKLIAFWQGAVLSTLSVIVECERRPDQPLRKRLSLRKHRENLAQWTRGCRENFQPMLDIIDGELAVVEGQHDDAASAFERAHVGASRRGITWLAGLASDRLARLARRRGQLILANAACDAAQEAFDAWGATGVVLRLERERIESIGSSLE